jgi:hypothetical protein
MKPWMTCLAVIALAVLFCSPVHAAERKLYPNPVGKVLSMVMLPVANTIDMSRDAVGFEADTDYASIETGETINADMVDLWRKQASPDEMNALGVKMTVVN